VVMMDNNSVINIKKKKKKDFMDLIYSAKF